MFTINKIFNEEEEESKGVDALMSYENFNIIPEAKLDNITKTISIIFDAPVAVIAMVDHLKICLKSNISMEDCEIIKEIAFCNYAIKQPDIFIVEDATKDTRFNTKPICC